MWSTLDGPRILSDGEASLVRGAIGIMLDHLVEEGRDELDPIVYGIDWFDQWDWRQRIWLLDQVANALLTGNPPPAPAAMLDATVDAIFCEVLGLIEMEIDESPKESTVSPAASSPEPSWRQSVLDAYTCQHRHRASIDRSNTDLDEWRKTVLSVADPIQGVRLYQKAEAYRDWDIERLNAFLRSRGLTTDYLDQIPSLCTIEQTQKSIEVIQTLVG